MGSDKIFMFDNPAAGESAGLMSMIPALLQNTDGTSQRNYVNMPFQR